MQLPHPTEHTACNMGGNARELPSDQLRADSHLCVGASKPMDFLRDVPLEAPLN